MEEKIVKLLRAALAQAEVHTANIARLTAFKPSTQDEAVDRIAALASEGVELAKCTATMFMIGAADVIIEAHATENTNAN